MNLGDDNVVLVKAQNVHNYFEEHGERDGWYSSQKYICCRLPFPSMGISFDWNPRKDSPSYVQKLRGLHIGMQLMSSNSPKAIATLNEAYVRLGELDKLITYSGQEIVVAIAVFLEGKDTGLSSMFVTTSDGEIIPHKGNESWFVVSSTKKATDDQQSALNHWMFHLSSTAAMTLAFMNCRNVQIIENPPSRQQRRCAERKGLPRPTSYKTLVINQMTSRVIGKRGSSSENAEMAMHIVRGNFKDYRSGEGLGKHHIHGIWWWTPHVRGSSEVGRVVKDYEVTP